MADKCEPQVVGGKRDITQDFKKCGTSGITSGRGKMKTVDINLEFNTDIRLMTSCIYKRLIIYLTFLSLAIIVIAVSACVYSYTQLRDMQTEFRALQTEVEIVNLKYTYIIEINKRLNQQLKRQKIHSDNVGVKVEQQLKKLSFDIDNVGAQIKQNLQRNKNTGQIHSLGSTFAKSYNRSDLLPDVLLSKNKTSFDGTVEVVSLVEDVPYYSEISEGANNGNISHYVTPNEITTDESSVYLKRITSKNRSGTTLQRNKRSTCRGKQSQQKPSTVGRAQQRRKKKISGTMSKIYAGLVKNSNMVASDYLFTLSEFQDLN